MHDVHDVWMVVGDVVYPLLVHVRLPRPPILKRCALRKAVWRRVEVSAFVERWVRSDEVYALAIHGAEELEVVAVKEGSVVPVGLHPAMISGRPA